MILDSVYSGATKTKIMYNACLSYAQLKEYLSHMEQNELIKYEEGAQLYRITEKGRKLMHWYQEIGNTLHEKKSLSYMPFVYPQLQTRFAEVWGHKIRYLEQGSSDRNVILVHGLGGSAERWLEVMPLLSYKYRVIAPDMIGFGHSDKPLTDYTIEFFAKFLSSFIDSLGINKTILIGTSLGGQIAAQCAASDDAIEKLVLVAPSGAMKHSTPTLDAYIMAALYPNQISARIAFEMMLHSGTVDEFTVTDFVKTMTAPNAKLAFLSSVLSIKNSQIHKGLRKIKIPTLLVWGNEDKMIPIEYAKEFLGSIRNCKFLELKGMGHLPHVERPEMFSESVLEFLDSKLVIAR
jgi:2-hydroxy-6-oxonona-2,4-dienedioate hydrolase